MGDLSNGAFWGALGVSSAAQCDFQGERKVIVAARYRDAQAAYQVGSVRELNGDRSDWRWRVPPLDSEKRAFRHSYTTIFDRDRADEKDWLDGTGLDWRLRTWDPLNRLFTYQIFAFNRDPGKSKLIGPNETDNPLLIVQRDGD